VCPIFTTSNPIAALALETPVLVPNTVGSVALLFTLFGVLTPPPFVPASPSVVLVVRVVAPPKNDSSSANGLDTLKGEDKVEEENPHP
jgi:hypothetical protein